MQVPLKLPLTCTCSGDETKLQPGKGARLRATALLKGAASLGSYPQPASGLRGPSQHVRGRVCLPDQQVRITVESWARFVLR